MINKDILKDDRISLPVEYSCGSCKDAILKKLRAYKSLLEENGVDYGLPGKVDKFCHNLEEMYKEYYLGHQNKAYENFKEALHDQKDGIGIRAAILPKGPLYRARTNEGDFDYKNDEMFHIKYEERGKVKTQRFSFPGLPCLYLGASSYVCWMELNRPQFDQFQVAAINQRDPNKDFKVIDLCCHPLAFYDELSEDICGDAAEKQMIEYLQWWPIAAACSIAVKNDNDPFKPEYIFPQFMLQYLLETPSPEKYIGIRYLSIKAGKASKKQYGSDFRTYTNYVLPIRTPEGNSNGFCTFLDSEFLVVRNYSGKELQVLSDLIRKTGVTWERFDEEERQHPLDNAKLYGTNDIPFPYGKSIFRRIEIILENKDLDHYTDDGTIKMVPITNEEIEVMFAE